MLYYIFLLDTFCSEGVFVSSIQSNDVVLSHNLIGDKVVFNKCVRIIEKIEKKNPKIIKFLQILEKIQKSCKTTEFKKEDLERMNEEKNENNIIESITVIYSYLDEIIDFLTKNHFVFKVFKRFELNTFKAMFVKQRLRLDKIIDFNAQMDPFIYCEKYKDINNENIDDVCKNNFLSMNDEVIIVIKNYLLTGESLISKINKLDKLLNK